jgi:hypothetical protein
MTSVKKKLGNRNGEDNRNSRYLKFGFSRPLRRDSNRIPAGAKMFNWYVRKGLVGVERTQHPVPTV